LAVSAISGARALYVLQNLKFYINHPQQILMLHRGGLSFYGGFVLATIFAVVFLKRQRLPVLKTFDIVCPYLALAQAIGRIGCFLNGCCYGKPAGSGLRVYFPGQDIARQPVQIYASLSLLLIFIILRTFQAKRGKKIYFSGQIFLLYCLLYSISRFFMEYLRGDNLPLLANLTVHQLISIGIFVSVSIIWWKKNEQLSS
ncbi:MAG: prolipoprotein diacylglyceryl transferase, partial [Candidatus Omnitrophica bacterium]|nr:prolipoprotein diacylglyceryl transferase [Candidatus Omnitrophota bacterium]